MNKMKRVLPLLIFVSLLCSCVPNTSDQKDENDVCGWSHWSPYYYTYFRQIIKIYSVRSKDKPDTDIEIIFDDVVGDGHVEVAKDKYDSIRVALGDTVRCILSDAYPPGVGWINNFEAVSLTSNKDYEGVEAGKPLNVFVTFTYQTPLPWLQSDRHVDKNGVLSHINSPEYTTVAINLDQLDPKDLNGCYTECKLSFSTSPDPEQEFVLSFKGPRKQISTSFCVPAKSTGY